MAPPNVPRAAPDGAGNGSQIDLLAGIGPKNRISETEGQRLLIAALERNLARASEPALRERLAGVIERLQTKTRRPRNG
jgi:hypothetical protein